MLILTRRISESIIIDKDIIVKILAVNGMQIKLGIEAPREISIHREEIQRRINSEISILDQVNGNITTYL